MTTEALRLPRPLVNQLLRQAQRAAERSQGWVLRGSHGELRAVTLPPETGLPAASQGSPPDAVFAFYRSFKTERGALTAGEIAALAKRTPLYLEVSLDTKGVLQLRAWQITGTPPVEREVAITDSADSTPVPE